MGPLCLTQLRTTNILYWMVNAMDWVLLMNVLYIPSNYQNLSLRSWQIVINSESFGRMVGNLHLCIQLGWPRNQIFIGWDAALQLLCLTCWKYIMLIDWGWSGTVQKTASHLYKFQLHTISNVQCKKELINLLQHSYWLQFGVLPHKSTVFAVVP